MLQKKIKVFVEKMIGFACRKILRPDINSRDRCVICGSQNVKLEKVTSLSKDNNGRVLDFYLCKSCDFAFAPGNTHPYSDMAAFSKDSIPSDTSGRVGDGIRGGREFYMYKTIAEALRPKRNSLDVLFFGCGLSRDYLLVQKDPFVRSVHITDLENFQGADVFIPLKTSRRFDVVIACEVVEHFVSPWDGFATLLGLIKPNGVVVCSTNMRDNSNLTKNVLSLQ